MTEPELTDAEKEAFRGITNAITDESANKLLNHHLGKTRRWLRWCAGNGYTPTLSDLVRQIMNVDMGHKQAKVALAVALWRLARRKEAELDRERGIERESDRDS